MLKIMAAAKFSIIIIIQVEVLISAHQLRIWYFSRLTREGLVLRVLGLDASSFVGMCTGSGS